MTNSHTLREDFISLKGRNIFYRYRPGTTDIFLSFLHGYPTSSLDYHEILERIPSEYNVIAHDHLGFGRSDKPLDSDYLLFEQADIANDLYAALGVKKLHIVAHDYGTSVATEIIARHNEGLLDYTIHSITLCNGSILIDMSKLRLIQKLLKNKWVGSIVAQLSSEQTFQKNMKNIWFDKRKYVSDDMEAHWKLLISKGGKKVLPIITRYIDQRYVNYKRWVGGLSKSNLPFHILWAENDPVAVVGMAYKLDEIISDSQLTIIKECGHYPMLEKELEWTNHVLSYIKNIDQK